MTDYAGSRAVAPLDRVHWGPVIAGMFTALAVLVLLSILAFAVGFGTTYRLDIRGGYGTGAIIWGAVAAFIAFGIGGFLAARWSGALGSGRAALHGFLVWAVGVPVLVYGLGAGVSPMLGTTSSETGGGTVIHATEMPGNTNASPNTNLRAGHIHSAAWWMLISLCAGLIGAAGAGAAGAPKVTGRYTTGPGTTPTV